MKRKDLAIVSALWLASWGLVAALGFAVLAATSSHALTDASQVPVLLYHSRTAGPECSADDTDVLAFERDAGILREEGYVLRPLLEVVYWRLGIWSGDRLPAKVAAISFDDGFDRDWMSGIPSLERYPDYPCPGLPSVREIAERDSIPVTFFVIASRVVRHGIQQDHMADNWWQSAEKHPLFSIGNHSIDHDHQSITQRIYDPDIPAFLPAAGHAGHEWHGRDNPMRWTNYPSATFAIQRSARTIHSITERWPVLFAHPMGVVSPYVHDVYFPSFPGEHKTLAAFCTEAGTHERLLTKTSDRWCLPRVGYRISWRTGDELRALLP